MDLNKSRVLLFGIFGTFSSEVLPSGMRFGVEGNVSSLIWMIF